MCRMYMQHKTFGIEDELLALRRSSYLLTNGNQCYDEVARNLYLVPDQVFL